MKQILLSVLIFVSGLLCGIVILSSLLSYAQKGYIDDLCLQFRANENIKAIEAAKKGDMYGTLIHRQNVVNTFDKEDNFFNFTEVDFSIWSVLQSYILTSVRDSTFNATGERLSEGLERGKLAFEYEKLGATSQAEYEWTIAVKLAGYSNKQQEFKKLILEMIEAEKTALAQ